GLSTAVSTETEAELDTNTHTEMLILKLQGNIHFRRGQYEESLSSFRAAFALSSAKGYALAAEDARVNIAGVLGKLKRYDEALEEFSISTHSQHRRNVMSAHVFMASSLIDLRRFDE